jgi:nicotinate dehydrogenase subunit B
MEMSLKRADGVRQDAPGANLDTALEREHSRRSFLRGAGTVAAGLGTLGAGAGLASAANDPGASSTLHTGAVAGPPNAAQIDSWLQINADNSATIFHGWVEMGQGSPTAVRMIAAEELGLDFDQVTAAQVDTNVSISALSADSSSTSTAMTGGSMRGAAAAARTLLLNMASARLGVPVGSLSVKNGVVSGGGQTVGYGELAAGKLFNSTIAAVNPALTSSTAYRLIGTRIARPDIPPIVTGLTTYIHNVRVPNMLHGRVVRPRGQAALGQGAKLLGIDPGSIAHIPGAQVVQKGNFVGVVAPKEWDAIRAAADLKVAWDATPKLPGNGNLDAALRNPANLQSSSRVISTGDVDAALAGAAKTVSASYFTAYQSHAPLGPNCSIADVTPAGALILCFNQAPYLLTRSNVASALGLPAAAVRVEVYPASGTYGHSTYDDASISAAVMSQMLGKPVRVQFMRWDENGWDQYGPAQSTDVRAGIDSGGKLVAFDYTAWNHGWTQVVESASELAGAPLPAVAPAGMIDTVNSGSFYTLPNRRVTGMSVNGYAGFLKGIWLRAPGVPQAVFASEQTIDALAHAANTDPIAFRIQNIDATQPNGVSRWIDVLDAVAKAAGWKPRVSGTDLGKGDVVTGRGVALGGYANSYTAIVAKISVNRKTGVITATHLYGAQDCGTAVNPASIENQIEGCLVQGASRALIEQVSFSRARVTSLDFATYPVIRFKQAPAVTAVVVQRLDQPATGSGEPTTGAVPAAIANAFFDATGVRLHQMPMTPGLVRGALGA